MQRQLQKRLDSMKVQRLAAGCGTGRADVFKEISEIIPFLGPYPLWVRGLVASWVGLSAICVAVLILARPLKGDGAEVQKPNSHDTEFVSVENDIWLKVGPVVIYNQSFTNYGVHVTININGNKFDYPSIAGARWLDVGPNMAHGLFRVPSSDNYTVIISMEAIKDQTSKIIQFISQQTLVISKSQIPYSHNYKVFKLNDNTRAADVSAAISFTLSTSPD
jgi:hypothetical protein